MVTKEILIVDDDYRNIFALKMVLKAKGFICKSAQSFKEAKEILDTNNAIKIILMDMMMPEIDGYEAISILKASQINIPILAVTAQAMPGDKEKCLNAGANGYISKPIDIDQLMLYINKYL